MTRRTRPVTSASRRDFLRAFGAGSVGTRCLVRGGHATAQEPGTHERGEWTTGPRMPDRRTEVAAATLDSELFVVGGFVPAPDDSADVTDRVVVFDPDDSSWRYAEPLPEPRHHAAAVSTNGNLYVVGGFADSDFGAVDTVWRYDGDEWTERAPLPAARGALAAAAVDGRICAVGGVRDELLSTVTVYDPERDQWTEREPMPTAREHLAAGAVEGTLYAVGGRTEFADVLDATESYDLEADEWTELAPMPTPRGGLAGTSLNDRVIAVGGEAPSGTFEAVEAYRPGRDSWKRLPSLPAARHGLGLAAVDGILYAASGGPTPGFAFSDALEIYRSTEAEVRIS